MLSMQQDYYPNIAASFSTELVLISAYALFCFVFDKLKKAFTETVEV